ncbi:uncharacterized protein TNCV_4717121 [Trichonephila clavipes]|nr:uncharacterized protein TNCV_4717121 [Trichonephila clavipes]
MVTFTCIFVTITLILTTLASSFLLLSLHSNEWEYMSYKVEQVEEIARRNNASFQWLPGEVARIECSDVPTEQSSEVANKTQAVENKNVVFYLIPAYGGVNKLCTDIEDGDRFNSCQVIYSQFGLAIHQNDHQERRRFVEWAQNEIAVVPDFHKRILFSDEAHFWLNGYVNNQNCRNWSEANPQVYVETPLHPEKLTVWCAL